MVQLIYKYDKCSECGQEKFQWGVVVEFITMRTNEQGRLERVTDHIFICHLCVKEIDIKLTDLEDEAKHKTFFPTLMTKRTGNKC